MIPGWVRKKFFSKFSLISGMNSEIVFTRFWHYFCLFLKVSNVRFSLKIISHFLTKSPCFGRSQRGDKKRETNLLFCLLSGLTFQILILQKTKWLFLTISLYLSITLSLYPPVALYLSAKYIWQQDILLSGLVCVQRVIYLRECIQLFREYYTIEYHLP